MTPVVVGTEEAVEVAAPPVLNLEMVVVHVVHSAAAGGWGSSLLAVAVAWALELQAGDRTVGHTFLVEFVAGMWVAFAEVLACSHFAVAHQTLVALAVVVVGKL